MDHNTPRLSFIGIVDFSPQARWLFCTESVSDLLGFEPHELIGTPSLDLVHPDEFAQTKQMHYDTIRADKAAVLAYLRMRHKDPYKGYILCAISRTVVHNVLVGSISFATPGAKAMHNASTAQEVTIISPSAKDFEFRRWNDPSPMPASPTMTSPTRPTHWPGSSPRSPSAASDTSGSSRSTSSTRAESPRPTFSTHPLTPQSVRTALILDRFSMNCPVIYITNEALLSAAAVGRSIFDFVARRDEALVRSWIDVIKAWGVNERGQPSDGGFGFGRFTVCVGGRDSSLRAAEPPPVRRRVSHPGPGAPPPPPRTSPPSCGPGPLRAHTPKAGHGQGRPRLQARMPSAPAMGDEISVDAIFSAHSDGLMVILRRAY